MEAASEIYPVLERLSRAYKVGRSISSTFHQRMSQNMTKIRQLGGRICTRTFQSKTTDISEN